MTKKAERFNEGKPKLSYNDLGAEANEGEARVWEFGGAVRGYDRGNWQIGCPYTEAADSLKRHLSAFLNGKDLDLNKEGKTDENHSGLPHVDHIICCAKILSQSFHTRKDLDDREGLTKAEKFFHNNEPTESQTTIKLTGAEIQSGLTRQRAAENLIIKSLPKDHDGRNTWLLNYGVCTEAEVLREKNNIKWNNDTNAAETTGTKS